MNNSGSLKTDGNLKVIVLEADLMLRHLYEAMVRDWQPEARVLAFDNGYDAWKEFQLFPPGLLITDDFHEGLHGNLIVTWITLRYSATPVLWTAPNCAHDLGALFGGLRHEILPKPFQRRDFMKRLDRLVPPKNLTAENAKNTESGNV